MGTPPVDEDATIEELTAQVRAQLDRVAVLEREAEPPACEPAMSRRGLLRRAGGYAAAGAGLAVGAGAWTAPASAADGGTMLLGRSNFATSATTLTASSAAQWAFAADNDGALQVKLLRAGALGMRVQGGASGILAETGTGAEGQTDAYGVLGSSSGHPGTIGSSNTQSGVIGQTRTGPAGVLGLNGSDAVNSSGLLLPPDGAGVGGTAHAGPGVAGVGGRAGQVGVYGASVDSFGVQARSTTSAAVRAVSQSGSAVVATGVTGGAIAANSGAVDIPAVVVSQDPVDSTAPAVQVVHFGVGNGVSSRIGNSSSDAAAVRGDGRGEAVGVLGVLNALSDGIDRVGGCAVVGMGYSGATGVFAYSDTGTSLRAGTNNGNVSPALAADAEGVVTPSPRRSTPRPESRSGRGSARRRVSSGRSTCRTKAAAPASGPSSPARRTPTRPSTV